MARWRMDALHEIDMAKAHMQGVVEGLDLARRILTGQEPSGITAVAVIGTTTELNDDGYVPASMRDDDEEEDTPPKPSRNHKTQSDPVSGGFQKTSDRLNQAATRRLAVARLIANGGPKTTIEVARAIRSTQSLVHSSVGGHVWFDRIGSHIHLSPVGLAAVRDADGDTGEEGSPH